MEEIPGGEGRERSGEERRGENRISWRIQGDGIGSIKKGYVKILVASSLGGICLAWMKRFRIKSRACC